MAAGGAQQEGGERDEREGSVEQRGCCPPLYSLSLSSLCWVAGGPDRRRQLPGRPPEAGQPLFSLSLSLGLSHSPPSLLAPAARPPPARSPRAHGEPWALLAQGLREQPQISLSLSPLSLSLLVSLSNISLSPSLSLLSLSLSSFSLSSSLFLSLTLSLFSLLFSFSL